MKPLLLSALLVTAAGIAVPATASAAPPPPPVSVTFGPEGVCVTVSLEVPQCVAVGLVKSVGVGQRLPVGVPYRSGNEVCWDPTPTSKGPCVNVG
ncbi:MAG: hypothetical protein QOG99_1277 [Frankiales bacterium]|jgi:hypothetical protein|nr:hypothetical protein [Frankiales bacterium]